MIGMLVHVLITTMMLSLCSGSNFPGPRNITRNEGTEEETIPCQLDPVQATPFWKINGTIYHYSDVPPPFVASRSGRDIIILTIDLTLSGTSFQCFIPSSSGGDLISSSTGVLTVTDIDHLNLLGNNHPQPKIVIIHQNLTFFPNAVMITWRALNDRRCVYYQLVARQSCGLNSNAMVLVNRTKEETVIIEAEVLTNFTYFHLTAYDEQGSQLCEELYLESFQFGTGTVTEDISLCISESDVSDSCSPTPTCIVVPALNVGQTLILALPLLPITTGLEEDLLCPVHPLPGERCVDLFSCNRFRESAYANSITICRRANNGSSLEMCFHNVTDVMNGTRLHFFYSDLHCHPNGVQLESTRLYTKSIQLHVTKIVTEDVVLCQSCAPTCIDVPPMTSQQTLVLALPYLPATSELEEDLLCPVQPFPGERCVDLLSCNRFHGSAYADSITICRTINDSSSLEMCFYNVTDVLNGTRLHFFYSDLIYCPSGLPRPSRTYIKSIQLIIYSAVTYGTFLPSTTPTSTIPSQSNAYMRKVSITVLLSFGLILTFACGLFLGAGSSCAVYCSFQKWKRSNPKGGEEMNISVTNNPAYEVVHLR